MKKHLDIIVAAAAAALGLLALISFALPAFVFPVGNDTITLADITFGNEEKGFGTSIIYVIVLVIEILGLLLLVPLFFKLKKGKIIFLGWSVVFFVVAAVMLLVFWNDSWVAKNGIPHEDIFATLKLYSDGCAMLVGGIALAASAVLEFGYCLYLYKYPNASK